VQQARELRKTGLFEVKLNEINEPGRAERRSSTDLNLDNSSPNSGCAKKCALASSAAAFDLGRRISLVYTFGDGENRTSQDQRGNSLR
jgi:hypothetical protein